MLQKKGEKENGNRSVEYRAGVLQKIVATADFYTQDGGLDVSSAQQQYIRHELEIRVF